MTLTRIPLVSLYGALILCWLVVHASASAQQVEMTPAPSPEPTVRLSLEEARQRARANSKLLGLAVMNIRGKQFATKEVQADYFPKLVGNVVYFHFDSDLGKVFTLQSGTSVAVDAIQQDTEFTSIDAVQPITDLWKIRQGVKIAEADEAIARAQLEQGTRELLSGVEQLYWGLLAVQKIRGGAAEAVKVAEVAAKTKAVEAQIAMVEARQGLQEADKQLAEIQGKLLYLVEMPSSTQLELVVPSDPVMSFAHAEEAVGTAIATSMELCEAHQNIIKAEAAVAAGKVDFFPNIALLGGYTNQSAFSFIQQDIGYLSVVGSYTFVDWGKRHNTVFERENMVAMARLKYRQTEETIRQKTQKAYGEVQFSEATWKTAQEMVEARKKAEQQATAPLDLLTATKARMLSEVDFIKADLARRQAIVQLMSLTGNH
jgi:outer membrane protein